MKIKKLGEVT